MRRLMIDLWNVCWRELLHFFRQRTRILMSIVQPVIWLVLIGNMMSGISNFSNAAHFFGGKSYITFMAPGVMVMTALFGGIFGGLSVVWDRRFGYLYRLLSSPISRMSIPLGKMVASSLQSGFQVILIILIALLLGVRFSTGIPGIFVIILIVMFFGFGISGISVGLGVVIKRHETMMAVVNFFTMPLMFTSNALFPTQLMPKWLATIAKINPVSYVIAPLRALTLGGWTWTTLLPDLAVLVIFGVVTAIIAGFLFRRTIV